MMHYKDIATGGEITRNMKNCFNCDEYSPCRYIDHFQQGGGDTSPDFSYIYCALLREKVLVEPPLGGDNMPITDVYVPQKCPIIYPKEEQLCLII